jgi:hypothetical protein
MNASPSATDIAEFRNSITPDLYEAARYIDWEEIERGLEKYADEIGFLQSAVDGDFLNTETLTAGLQQHQHLYEVACLLLALPQAAIGFSDGRELPESGRRLSPTQATVVAPLLFELGLSRLIVSGIIVRSLVRAALTNSDAGKRRYRVGATIKERLKKVLDEAIALANQESNLTIERVPESLWPHTVRGRVDCILALGSRQSIAVVSVFQTATGGRQLNELSTIYPNMQREIAELGLNLILVADGRGVREARESILRSLFVGVASCMTFRQAANGRLLQEILRLIKTEPPSQERRALKSIIHAAISSGRTISVKDLPADNQRSSVALAAFANENSEWDLALDPASSSISWRKQGLVQQALVLKNNFSSEAALAFFTEIFTTSQMELPEQRGAVLSTLVAMKDGDGIIPKKLLVGVTTMPNAEVVREMAMLALTKSPESKMSVLLTAQTLDGEVATHLRRLQSTLTSNVIVLDGDILLRMAQSKEAPKTILARQLLEQSDLIKASPFVLNSVTPSRMFYGRETEEADMVSTLGSNSVALLGGRRIGKTSLMRHVDQRLRDGGFKTFFGDCQTVRDWDGFAQMANSRWGIPLAHPFRPNHLFDLVKQLRGRSNSKVVFLLDEIDQLLDWDKKHADDQVPEAFFRACRTVSQEGDAQFVFSGERTIAARLWDAQSPHWNFCQPLMLRQLDRNSASQLLIKPLRAMQIVIADEPVFADAAWLRTSGHPQLLQTLGDALVRRLNEKPPTERGHLSARDLVSIADAWSFAEAYLETYWGQATSLERVLTLLVVSGYDRLEVCRDHLNELGVKRSIDEVRAGLRMLELYGIIDAAGPGYRVRLDWFAAALGYYGTREKLLDQYVATLK